jgi:GTP-binding protein HflX
MIEIKNVTETAVLVGLSTARQDLRMTEEHLDELAFLLDTAGGVPSRRFVQRLDMADPRTYVGRGKIAEIRGYIKEKNIDLVVFDDELSPAQFRNIEKELECRIIDRNNLILDIFARRAQTSYAKMQVELAQCEYLLPRLTRRWTHLEKQRGGIGLRGPGEQEIETDRRYLRYRISLLKKKLEGVDKQKATQRKNRRGMIRVSLVGYTNVGKSTIMNVLSKSNLFAENKLFATLDTTIRKVVAGDQPFLLSDTVGFIRKLPHTLIESFKSTLDEVREADILLHIVDISHPDFEEQMHVVKQTLVEIGAADKPTYIVFNKIDAYSHTEKEADDLTPATEENIPLEELEKSWMAKENIPSIFISAKERTNISELRNLVGEAVRNVRVQRYPFRQKDVEGND